VTVDPILATTIGIDVIIATTIAAMTDVTTTSRRPQRQAR
jgi:hypothetical protein